MIETFEFEAMPARVIIDWLNWLIESKTREGNKEKIM